MHICNGNDNISSEEFTIAHTEKKMPIVFRFSTKDLGGLMSIANVLGKCKDF